MARGELYSKRTYKHDHRTSHSVDLWVPAENVRGNKEWQWG